MNSAEKEDWLIKYCNRKLEAIEEQEYLSFTSNERYFLKGLDLLYKLSFNAGNSFSKRYNRIVRKKEIPTEKGLQRAILSHEKNKVEDRVRSK